MYKCGLVLEGGGSRGIYTAGVLDAFMENEIEFPYVIGVSMGSCCGASFLGKNIKRQHDVILFSAQDKRYMSFTNLRKRGEYCNFDWTGNTVINSGINVFTNDRNLPGFSSYNTGGSRCRPVPNGYFTPKA